MKSHKNRRSNQARTTRMLIESFEPRLLLSTSAPFSDLATFVRAVKTATVVRTPNTPTPATWTGAAHDLNWSTAANWQNNTVPAPGQNVELPDVGSTQNIDVSEDVTVGSITLDGHYYLNNHTITVNGDITVDTTGSGINSPLIITHDTTVTVAGSTYFSINATSDGGNDFGLTKEGSGVLYLSPPTSSYTGATHLAHGTLGTSRHVDSTVTIDPDATLELRGTVGGVTGNGGTLSLGGGNSVFTSTANGDLTLPTGSTLRDFIGFDDDVNTEQDCQLIVTGSSINITDATLDIGVASNFTPEVGHSFTLIANQTGAPIVGTFAGLAEGAQTVINGVGYQISYLGGESGHDVTLTIASPADIWTGAGADNLWSNPDNWQGGAVPLSDDNVLIDNSASDTHVIDVDVPVTIGSMTLHEAYLHGESITLQGDLFDNGQSLVLDPIILTHDTTIQSSEGFLLLGGQISDGGNHFGLTIANNSAVIMVPFEINDANNPVLAGGTIDNTYTGDTNVSASILLVEGNLTSTVRFDTGSTFVTSGAVASLINSESDATSTFGAEAFNFISTPLPGTLIVDQNLLFSVGTGVQFILGGTEAGDGTTADASSQIHVLAGTIELGGADLSGSLSDGYAPANGDIITIIKNDTGTPVTGTFQDLAEGATVTIDNQAFTISYAGGESHNDVTLTAVAPATKLVIDQQPTDTAAGDTIESITVEIDDANGNLFSSDAAVTLTSDASVDGTLTVNAVDGIATFDDISITEAGDYSLTFTADDLTSATSDDFSITPGAPTTLVISQPPTDSARTGEAIGDVEVDVEDAFGNIVTDDASDVTISAESDGNPADDGVLAGTTTVTAENGVAVFSDLSITQPGTYSLTAEDGELDTATTDDLTITPAPLHTYNAVAGKKFSPITIDALEAFPDADPAPKTLSILIENESGKSVLAKNVSVKHNKAVLRDLSFNKAGTYTMTVTAPDNTAITNEIIITPAAPAKLTFVTQPAFTSGHTSVSVAVQDNFGNLTTAVDGATVTLRLTPRPAVAVHPQLRGTVTAKVVNGLATFSNISINRPVRDQFIATSGKLRQAKSNVFKNATSVSSARP